MLKELKSKFEKKTKSKIDFGAVKTILKGNRGSLLLIPRQKNGTAFNRSMLQFVLLTSCAGSP